MINPTLLWILIILGAVIVLVAIVWLALPDHKRRFYWNLIRQAPKLPGRYKI
jgi:hypothetical protein